MATDVKMPQLSDTMDAGKIIVWKKKEGDVVSRGDVLAEVETDKANLEIECFQQGTLLKIVVPAGSAAKVGEVIAVIGAAGEVVSISPEPSPVVTAQPEAFQAEGIIQPERTLKEPAVMPGAGRIKASPLARKAAEELRIDISAVKGSGPSGRILMKDVETAALGAPTPPGPARISAESYGGSAESAGPVQGRVVPLSRMRETIARRMQESVTQAPHFYVTISVDMEQSMKLHAVLRERAEYRELSINHLVIKAAAYALSQERQVNSAFRDGQIFEPSQINIGIITATADGLLIPIIKEADRRSLREVMLEARAAVGRARAGKPNSNDLSGGTFSISNMGMFDIENFTAIINPGQGAALAVSSVKEEPVIRNGVVVPGLRMKATLSLDHRIIDGVMAAGFMKHFKHALEMPALLAI